jgi:uncharacterized membrane protein YfbV (UPF0208 family)
MLLLFILFGIFFIFAVVSIFVVIFCGNKIVRAAYCALFALTILVSGLYIKNSGMLSKPESNRFRVEIEEIDAVDGKLIYSAVFQEVDSQQELVVTLERVVKPFYGENIVFYRVDN